MRTARAEVTDRILIAGQRHLCAVLDEYAGHYNQHRPHRARDLRPPDCDDIATAEMADLATARIRRRRILGGLINEYERAARPPTANRDVAAQRSRTGLRNPTAFAQNPDQRRAVIAKRAASTPPSGRSAGQARLQRVDLGRRGGHLPAFGAVTRSRVHGRGSYLSCRCRAVRVRRADGDDDAIRAPRSVSALRAVRFLRCRDAWCAGDGGPGTPDCWSGDPCGS